MIRTTNLRIYLLHSLNSGIFLSKVGYDTKKQLVRRMTTPILGREQPKYIPNSAIIDVDDPSLVLDQLQHFDRFYWNNLVYSDSEDVLYMLDELGAIRLDPTPLE